MTRTLTTDEMKVAAYKSYALGRSFKEIAEELTATYGRPFTNNSVAGILFRKGALGAHRPWATGPRGPTRRIRYGKVTCQQLTTTMCRWPKGDPKQPDFGFCGRTKAAKSSYCEDHTQKAWLRTSR